MTNKINMKRDEKRRNDKELYLYKSIKLSLQYLPSSSILGWYL